MSIFHNKDSLAKRKKSVTFYSSLRLNLFKSGLALFGVLLIFLVIVPMLLPEYNLTNLKIKRVVEDSKGNEIYLENVKYKDEESNSIVEASKAYTYSKNTNERDLNDAKITKKDTGEIFTANHIKIRSDKKTYTATGRAKYISDDITVNADNAVYNDKTGKLKATGNLKIVIKE